MNSGVVVGLNECSFVHVTCAGFNVETVPHAKHELVMWDVGGRNAVSGNLTHCIACSEKAHQWCIRVTWQSCDCHVTIKPLGDIVVVLSARGDMVHCTGDQ